MIFLHPDAKLIELFEKKHSEGASRQKKRISKIIMLLSRSVTEITEGTQTAFVKFMHALERCPPVVSIVG